MSSFIDNNLDDKPAPSGLFMLIAYGLFFLAVIYGDRVFELLTGLKIK